jgi:hypothetical protein
MQMFQIFAVLDVSISFFNCKLAPCFNFLSFAPSFTRLSISQFWTADIFSHMGSGSVRTQKANNMVSVCTASNCLSSLQASPACADNSWSLWNATDSAFEFGFFCCLPDQAGLATGSCIAASQVPAYKNQIGVLVRRPLHPFLYNTYYKKTRSG